MRVPAAAVLPFLLFVAGCPQDADEPPAPTCGVIDDGNPCTLDTCEGAMVVSTPEPAGAGCAGGVCDGNGACVECVDDDGCDGNRVCDTATNTCVACTEDADCGAGSVCDEPRNACVPATCVDGEQNENETDLDCGGGGCAPCADGGSCGAGADCTSGVCAGDVCQVPRCGDGVRQNDEVCDDAAAANGDGCDNGVGGNCTPTACGNGVITGTEVCDDGNAANGDGCDDGEFGNCTASACGNGVVAGDEACDDGGTAATDGCDAGCAEEPGYLCTGSPSVCERAMTIRINGYQDGDRVAVLRRNSGGAEVGACAAPECQVFLPVSDYGYALSASLDAQALWTGCDSTGGTACHVRDRDAVVEVEAATLTTVEVEGAGTVNVYEFIPEERLNPTNLLMSCSNATCTQDLGRDKLRLLAEPPPGLAVRWEGCSARPDSGGGNQYRVCYAFAGDVVRASFFTPDTITVRQVGGVGEIEVAERRGASLGTCSQASCEFAIPNPGVRVRVVPTVLPDGVAAFTYDGCEEVRRGGTGRRLNCYFSNPESGPRVTISYDTTPFSIRHVAGTGAGTTRVSFGAPRGATYGTCPSSEPSCEFQVARGTTSLQQRTARFVRIDFDAAPGSVATVLGGACLRSANLLSSRCYTSLNLFDEVSIRYDLAPP